MSDALRNAITAMIRDNWPAIQETIQAEIDNAVYKAVMQSISTLERDSYRRSDIASSVVAEVLASEIDRQTRTVYKPALERLARYDAEKALRKRLKARGLSAERLDEWLLGDAENA